MGAVCVYNGRDGASAVLQLVDLGESVVVFIDIELLVRDFVLVQETLEDAAVRAPVGAEYAERGLRGYSGIEFLCGVCERRRSVWFL